jgi:hypothetical protein
VARHTIDIAQAHGGDPLEFVVTVRGKRETKHAVVVCEATLEQLAPPGTSPERFVRAAFEFLLDRESNESILPRFDVSVIERYFSDFPKEIGTYLTR